MQKSIENGDGEIRIISLKAIPEYREYAVEYISGNWPPVKNEFEKDVNKCLAGDSDFPNCYLMLKSDEIIGCYTLLEHEIIENQELSPWISCVFIDEKERGKRLSEKLLIHGRRQAGKLGYKKVYLTTDHIRFYEKFGFREIGLSKFVFGRPTKIYENDKII